MRLKLDAVMRRLTLTVGGLLAIAVSLSLGVFNARTPDPIAAQPAGATIETGQWRLTPLKLEIGAVTPDGRLAGSGKRALILTADLTNRTSESSNAWADTLRVVNAPEGLSTEPQLYLLRDQALAGQMQPGLREQVAFVWTFDAATPPDATVRFEVVSYTFKARNNLEGRPGWFNPQVIGAFVLPAGDPAASAGRSRS